MDYQGIIEEIVELVWLEFGKGKVVDYILVLVKVFVSKFGIVVCMFNGDIFQVGDVEEVFFIQSIFKVFVLV